MHKKIGQRRKRNLSLHAKMLLILKMANLMDKVAKNTGYGDFQRMERLSTGENSGYGYWPDNDGSGHGVMEAANVIDRLCFRLE